MSTFSAGAITGTLGLDISEYSEAMRESQSLAGIFAEEIGHILSEATGSPLLGELANGISEVVAAAGDGNWGEAFAASIHTASGLVSGMIEVTKKQAEEMHNMGLAAERAGVSVQFISSIGAIAKDSGVGVDELGMSMKFLEDRAANAVDGQKDAIEAFTRVGISSSELAGLLKDPEELFFRVSDGMKAIAGSGREAQAAQDLMSRSGSMMRPMLEQGSAALKQNAADIIALGGAYTDQDASMGQSVAELETRIDASMIGIEKAFARPILQALIDNSQVLSADMGELAGWIGQNLPNAMREVGPMMKEFGENIKVILNAFTGADGGELTKDAHEQAARDNHRFAYDLISPDNVGNWTAFKDLGKDLYNGLLAADPNDPGSFGLPGWDVPGGGPERQQMSGAYTAAQRGATAPHVTVNAPVTIDPSRLADEFVKKAKPAMRRANASLQTQLHAATKKADAQDYGL
jgi:hypothetical protein